MKTQAVKIQSTCSSRYLRQYRPLLQAAFGICVGLCLLAGAVAGPGPHRDHVSRSRHDLGAWQEIYWRWYFGDLALPVDRNGNAVLQQVVLMPIPATPGDGTPGHLDVTLDAGQAWVLPLFVLPGTSYSDGTPPDRFVDPNFFATFDILFQIDGKTLIEPRNVMDYFTIASLNPPIPFDYPPLAAIIWVEGLTVMHHPLSVGTHTLKLDVRNTQPVPPEFGGGFAEFHNTWTVTVRPRSE